MRWVYYTLAGLFAIGYVIAGFYEYDVLYGYCTILPITFLLLKIIPPKQEGE